MKVRSLIPVTEHALRTAPSAVSQQPVSSNTERGQSVIEFTLVMPIIFLVITGVLSFGIALHNFLVLTNGVSVGAQVLAISRGQTTDPCSTASTAIQNVSGLSSGLSLSFVIDGVSYPSTTTCTAGASNMVQGTSAQVTATYPCTLAIFDMTLPSCSLRTQVTEYIQ